jgi:hypothetical protein
MVSLAITGEITHVYSSIPNLRALSRRLKSALAARSSRLAATRLAERDQAHWRVALSLRLREVRAPLSASRLNVRSATRPSLARRIRSAHAPVLSRKWSLLYRHTAGAVGVPLAGIPHDFAGF